MKGSAHAAIGAATGIGTALWLQSDPLELMLYTGAGAIAALVPDLDVNGKLANKITIEKKWLILFFAAAGILLAVYSYLFLFGIRQAAGFLFSVCLLILPRLFIKQRTMLFVTGAAVIAAGWYIERDWILYSGLFIVFASLVSHRTWTHSIIGIIAFYIVAAEIGAAFAAPDVTVILVAAYISHLIADMKIWPANKRGTKFFYPLWRKEF